MMWLLSFGSQWGYPGVPGWVVVGDCWTLRLGVTWGRCGLEPWAPAPLQSCLGHGVSKNPVSECLPPSSAFQP